MAALFTGLDHSRSWCTWMGLAFFGCVAIFALAIVAPATVYFDVPPERIADGAQSMSTDAAMRKFAVSRWRSYQKNKVLLDNLHRLFFLGICAFAAEMVLLVLAAVVN